MRDVTSVRQQLVRWALLSLLTTPGCGSSGPDFQVTVSDYKTKRLSASNDDPLFILEIVSFAGTLATRDLSVESVRGTLSCVHPSGDQFLRAGSLLLCSEPSRDLFDAADEGNTYSIAAKRKTGGAEETFSTAWIPLRTKTGEDAGPTVGQ